MRAGVVSCTKTYRSVRAESSSVIVAVSHGSRGSSARFGVRSSMARMRYLPAGTAPSSNRPVESATVRWTMEVSFVSIARIVALGSARFCIQSNATPRITLVGIVAPVLKRST